MWDNEKIERHFVPSDGDLNSIFIGSVMVRSMVLIVQDKV